ncbi:growth/differentiation factor 2 isoform X1 [Drosophila miranda]|uniref:growth/differentiation factor 2 isoform X1 n=2 Tax=Drosophila miranda TaxID=7229 RepID=UPI00143F7F48|nr:growth/differentiation factor 2 isoform X1 [Drosophila miranda]
MKQYGSRRRKVHLQDSPCIRTDNCLLKIMLANGYRIGKEHRTESQYYVNPSVKKIIENANIAVLHEQSDSSSIVFCSCKSITSIKKRQIIGGHSRCPFVMYRCVALAVLSMLLILATAHSASSEQELLERSNNSSSASARPEIILLSNRTNTQSNTLSSDNASSTTKQIKPEDHHQEDSDPPSNPVKVQTKRNTKGSTLPTTSRSGPFSSVQGVSMNRNLINIDSILQRQLREKAKQDSLESIKMHILMRLNLKKLPNITKPISVPQNILEDFYKGYNASVTNTIWRRRESTGESLSESPSVPKKHEQNTNTSSDLVAGESDMSLSSQMQGDDANALNEFKLIYNTEIGIHEYQNIKQNFFMDNDDEYESILSHISSIYVFPEQLQPHVRHNRKTDVLRFKFDNSYSDISYATLHLYLRGWDWISTHQPELIEEIENQQSKDIVVAIHRAVRRANNTSFTHKAKMFEFRQKIPSGQGQWVNVDLKPVFGDRGSNKSHEILIKGVESWMKPLVVTTDNTSNNPLTVHIEIGSQKKHRRKRSVYMDCTESDHDMRCCRYPLKVNFTSFGWHFVVAPTSFDAYFCSGDCRVGYLEQYPHTHLAALTTSATPCCSPTKMSSLSLLYFDDNHNLVLSVIPNMSVEGCSCS